MRRNGSEIQWLTPGSLEEALRFRAQLGSTCLPLAGGTDLMLRVRAGHLSPAAVMSLRGLGLEGVVLTADSLTIGASSRIRDILGDPQVTAAYPLLRMALGRIGSPQIRNLATVGGNMANASPCADSAIPLLVMDAVLTLESLRGSRRIRAVEFFTGPRATLIQGDELLTELTIPRPAPGSWVWFDKFGPRRANVISASSLGMMVSPMPGGARAFALAAGSVAPRPVRLSSVEQFLGDLDDAALGSAETRHQAMELVAKDISPIDDQRGSAWYKARVLKNAVERALLEYSESCLGGRNGN